MKAAILAMLIIVTTGLWVFSVVSIMDRKVPQELKATQLKFLICALCLMTPLTIAYGTYFGK
jgi:hypothetical protein